MKKLLPILLILIYSYNVYAQVSFFNVLNKPESIPITNIKNPQFVNTDSIYCLGGFLEWTNKPWQITHYYRQGTSHLAGGNIYKQDYIVNGDMWSDTVLVEKGDTDVRDVYGGRLRNIDNIQGRDSLIIFCGRSLNGIGGSSPSNWSINLYILRGDTNGHFGSRIPFSFGTFPHRLQRCYFFGHIAKGEQNGEYYIPLYEGNVDTGNLSRHLVNVVKTMDWFRTYRILNVFDLTSYPGSEASLAYIGHNKLNLIVRMEQLGHLDQWESSDSGHTWVDRQSNNLYFYALTDVIPSTYFDTVGHKQYFLVNDRDNDFLYLSARNDTTIFGGTNPTYQGPELFYYNQSEDHAVANTSLGYANMIRLLKPDGSADSSFLSVWFHETNLHRANVMWTRNYLGVDPGGIPSAPSLASSFITSTSFRYDISGYTTAQLSNIRYFIFDLSTDNFSTYVTAKYLSPSLDPGEQLHNIYLHSNWDKITSLTTGTTYNLRVKACNTQGCSAFTTINVTTL